MLIAINYSAATNRNPGKHAALAKYNALLKPGKAIKLMQIANYITATSTVSTSAALKLNKKFPAVI